MKLLSGQLEADSGLVKRADYLKVVVFDQHREQLDMAWTLKRALGDGSDYVAYQGRNIHVNSWGPCASCSRPSRWSCPCPSSAAGSRPGC